MRNKLILASRSPQRSAILTQLGIPFEVRPAQVEERMQGDPAEVVRENALAKARAVASSAGEAIVLGVDTIVVLDGRIYGKPADWEQARDYLEQLSGRGHEVWSAIALMQDGDERVETTSTRVFFRRLDQGLLDWYLAADEWRERAEAYAIQGRGSALVERIEGDHWNVVGLPVALLAGVAPELFASTRT